LPIYDYGKGDMWRMSLYWQKSRICKK